MTSKERGHDVGEGWIDETHEWTAWPTQLRPIITPDEFYKTERFNLLYRLNQRWKHNTPPEPPPALKEPHK